MCKPALYKRPLPALLVLLLVMTAATGCVRRRLTVRTNPPGATVYVDNQKIGASPCSVDFTYYGTREIRMVKPGYETLTVNQPIPTPAYDMPGVDFVTENLLPTKIRDNRVVSFNLAPQRIVPAEELIGRGQQLRDQTSAGPAPPVVGPVITGPAPSFTPAPPPGPTPVGPPAFVSP